MTDPSALASWVELEGCFNFRDLGGYRTRDGRRMREGQVFRADGLQHLTPSDLEQLCGGLNLGAVIDLRSSDEISEDGRGAIAERATIHHVPLFENTRSHRHRDKLPKDFLSNMGELYLLMLRGAREPIVRVVRLLAESAVPTVFHCAAGKDRTGVISALLLSLLGVPEDTIVADYAFSRRNIDQINARLGASASYQRLMDAMPEDAYDAHPAAMQIFLERVREEHGSMVEWSSEAGIDAATRERLQARLLL